MNVPFSLWYINEKSWKWVCKCVSFFNQKSDPRIHFKDCLPQMMACLLVNFLLVILGLPTQKKKQQNQSNTKVYLDLLVWVPTVVPKGCQFTIPLG